MANKLEATLERWVFATRWLLAPFFIGLVLAIAVLLVKFVQTFWVLVLGTFSLSGNAMIIQILSLVDGALIGALLLIIGFAGYENFVSKIGIGDHEDRPAWMGKVGFSDLKIKLMGALVAISAVELLKEFIDLDENTPWQILSWKVGIHMTFVFSGVLFASPIDSPSTKAITSSFGVSTLQTTCTLCCKALTTAHSANLLPCRKRNRRTSSSTPHRSGERAEDLRYIRDTIAAAGTFTTVPGKGCIAMGITALAASGLESLPGLAPSWLPIWVGAAIMACAVALYFMEEKAKAQGLSLRRAVARRFFMTLVPAFVAGGVLTAALVHEIGRNSITGLWLLLYGSGLAACGVFAVPAVLVAGLAFMALGTVALGLPASWSPAILASASAACTSRSA
jgi:uncharacterized protein (TIGR00645 family)